MQRFKDKYIFGVLVASLVWLAINTVFVCFIHYDSQNRILSPMHYDVRILTRNEYKELVSPESTHIVTSNGSTIIKSDSWDLMKSYKAVEDGSRYVQVVTKGTAHLVSFWLTTAMPMIICFILTFFIAFWPKRHPKAIKSSEV